MNKSHSEFYEEELRSHNQTKWLALLCFWLLLLLQGYSNDKHDQAVAALKAENARLEAVNQRYDAQFWEMLGRLADCKEGR